jgi:hypothetical protein
MRTTLTLEDSIATQLRRLAHNRQTSLKDTVNQALELGLRQMTASAAPKPYRTRARRLGAFRGIDPTRLGQIDDEASDLDRMGSHGSG